METIEKPAWAEALVGKVVLHAETGLVGRVDKLVAPGEALGLNGKPVGAWVLFLDEGSTLVATSAREDKRELFVELSEAAARYYVVIVTALSSTLTEGAKLGASVGVGLPLAERLVLSALEAQLRAIKRGAPSPWPEATT